MIADIICGRHSNADRSSIYVEAALRKLLAALPPIIANICIVPFVLRYAYGVALPIPIMMVTVGVGEVNACEVLGCILASVYKYKLQIWKTAA